MKLPKRALTNIDLYKYVKLLKIPHFRGVFMRDTLPKSGAHSNECGIMNLDMEAGPGTHWVAYKKSGTNVIYFDSYGNLRPPLELIEYLQHNSPCHLMYNHENLQSFNAINCGHLCLRFLYNCYN